MEEKKEFLNLIISSDLFLIIFALFAAITVASLLRFIGKKSGKAVSNLIKDKDNK